MGMQECIQMMDKLIEMEEKRLDINSPEFMKKHKEIMNECDRQLLHDLTEERREEM